MAASAEHDWTMVSSDEHGDDAVSERSTRHPPIAHQSKGHKKLRVGRPPPSSDSDEVDDEGFVVTADNSDEVYDEGFVVKMPDFQVQIEEDSWVHALHSIGSSSYTSADKQEFNPSGIIAPLIREEEEEAAIDAVVVKSEDDVIGDRYVEDKNTQITGHTSCESMHAHDYICIHGGMHVHDDVSSISEGKQTINSEDMHTITGPLNPEKRQDTHHTVVNLDKHVGADGHNINVDQADNDEGVDGADQAMEGEGKVHEHARSTDCEDLHPIIRTDPINHPWNSKDDDGEDANNGDKHAGIVSYSTEACVDMQAHREEERVVEELNAQQNKLIMETSKEPKDDACGIGFKQGEPASFYHLEEVHKVDKLQTTSDRVEVNEGSAQEKVGLSNDQEEVPSDGRDRIKGKAVLRPRKEAGACKLIKRSYDDPVERGPWRAARKKPQEERAILELAERIARSKAQLRFDEEQKACVQALEDRLMNLEARYASQQEELARVKSHIQRRSRASDQKEARNLCHLTSEKNKRELLQEAPVYRAMVQQWPYKTSVNESTGGESSARPNSNFLFEGCKELYKKVSSWSSWNKVRTRDRTAASVRDVQPTHQSSHSPNLGTNAPAKLKRSLALGQIDTRFMDSTSMLTASSGAMGILGWMLAGCCNCFDGFKSERDEDEAEHI